jgi:hypothetical protein
MLLIVQNHYYVVLPKLIPNWMSDSVKTRHLIFLSFKEFRVSSKNYIAGFFGASYVKYYAIAICLAGFGFASSLLGMVTLRIPLSYLALILSLSTVFGSVNERLNDW